jgi:hypothetical protein
MGEKKSATTGNDSYMGILNNSANFQRICMKLAIPMFLGSLIMNPESNLRNPKWRIQYGDRKNENLFDCYETWYLGVFWVAEYELEV